MSPQSCSLKQRTQKIKTHFNVVELFAVNHVNILAFLWRDAACFSIFLGAAIASDLILYFSF